MEWERGEIKNKEKKQKGRSDQTCCLDRYFQQGDK